jgi:hypothetical protein
MAKKVYPVAKSSGKSEKRNKRVLIGTPALDGRVDAWFCFALHELGKAGLLNGIDFNLILLSYESILPMARNEILTTAIEGQFDALVFIDSDVYCAPETLIQIIQDDREVVAIPTVKKSDQETYDISFDEEPEPKGDWVKASRVSTSCLKLGKKMLQALGENSQQIFFRGKYLKNICQYDFFGEGFMGEDIFLCEKIKKLGFDVWLNTSSTCMHIGPKVYTGDFKRLLSHGNKTN